MLMASDVNEGKKKEKRKKKKKKEGKNKFQTVRGGRRNEDVRYGTVRRNRSENAWKCMWFRTILSLYMLLDPFTDPSARVCVDASVVDLRRHTFPTFIPRLTD